MPLDLTVIGLELVLLGMGTVFAFLTLLVFVTSLMSRLVIRFSSAETLKPVPLTATEQTESSPVIFAAVAAAVRRYRDGQAQ
jgi:oxaloacetate decarboxylase (Na+ extruding) subunit gamma